MSSGHWPTLQPSMVHKTRFVPPCTAIRSNAASDMRRVTFVLVLWLALDVTTGSRPGAELLQRSLSCLVDTSSKAKLLASSASSSSCEELRSKVSKVCPVTPIRHWLWVTSALVRHRLGVRARNRRRRARLSLETTPEGDQLISGPSLELCARVVRVPSGDSPVVGDATRAPSLERINEAPTVSRQPL